MRYFILAMFLVLVTPALAAADGGVTNSGENITYTALQTATIEIYDYEGDTEIDNLGVDFGDLGFISYVVSIAATVMVMVSDKAVLMIWTVIFIALLCVVWLLGVVMNKKMDAQLKEATLDLPTNEQLFELADDRTEFNQLIRERDAEVRVRRERVRRGRLTERISRSRLFSPVKGTYKAGGGVHRLSRGGGGFKRRRY